jgi:hypothetical protein
MHGVNTSLTLMTGCAVQTMTLPGSFRQHFSRCGPRMVRSISDIVHPVCLIVSFADAQAHEILAVRQKSDLASQLAPRSTKPLVEARWKRRPSNCVVTEKAITLRGTDHAQWRLNYQCSMQPSLTFAQPQCIVDQPSVVLIPICLGGVTITSRP